ncbi:hypothetical protein [Pedobacter endophyticus]|uniref:hypothetical protein n=1 Tax=Pedobacter endophyticus TaxID=2789740 RepID=UPI001E64E2AF|nr:hypothetical protein [Pedobacter endophyticus]
MTAALHAGAYGSASAAWATFSTSKGALRTYFVLEGSDTLWNVANILYEHLY